MFLESTSKFEVKAIIYQQGGFAIATGLWKGGDPEDATKLAIACRWYADGIGYPQTFGKPQWMLLGGNIEVSSITDLLNPTSFQILLRFT